LKDLKSKVNVHIPLHGKVRRASSAFNNKRKDYDLLLSPDQGQNITNIVQKPGAKCLVKNIPQAQFMFNADTWKFEMSDYELDSFPSETKKLFQNRELDSNPVLWIRVDPDMEFICKIRVVQDKKNWLYQLLREKDIIGQIEAIKPLAKQYADDFVYEVLKAVATNDNYFVIVR
jgi:hypothetical protein